jgi:hypothetical protein
MSGIKILFNQLLKQAAKDSGQASGIMSIGDSVRKLAENKLKAFVASAQRQGVDLDAMNEQQIKYILELNKPQNKMRVISQGDPEFENIMNQMLGRKKKADVFDLEGKKIEDTRNIMGGKEFIDKPRTVAKLRGMVKNVNKVEGDMKPLGTDYSASINRKEFFDPKAKNKYGEMVGSGSEFFEKLRNFHAGEIKRKTENMVSRKHPNYKILKSSLDDQKDALEAVKIAEDLGGNENMYDFLRMKNVGVRENREPIKRSDYVKDAPIDDPEDLATGGRAGFKMGRRAFLKALGAGLTGLGAAKTGIFSGFGKQGTKQVTKEIIKTPPVAGKPEWFDSLVNKVITQGDDVSKNFATQDRQVVHRVLLDKDGKAIDAKQADKIKQEGNVYDVEDITVTRNLDDGEIRVTYYSDKNMGAGDVELIYKPGQADEMTKGKPPDTFQAAEAEPRVTNYDGDIEYDGENLVNNIDDLYSDTNKLKQFATNQKPTMKEFIESKKKQEIVEEVNSSDVGANEYLSNKYGDPIYQEPDIDPDPFFASGGIARMLGE